VKFLPLEMRKLYSPDSGWTTWRWSW